MAQRFDFQCNAGHEFVLWSDAARMCPECGSEYLKRIFVDAPMVNTPRTKALDNLVRRELENRNITNIQGGGHEGDREKVTYKTTPAELAAAKIERDFPQMKDADAKRLVEENLKTRWAGLTPASVIKAGYQPNDLVKQMIPEGTVYRNGKHVAAPYKGGPNQLAINDRKMIQRQFRKDPDNLQIKK
jgi:hypothetical protein